MHRVVGAATIAAFIVTGIYLKLRGSHLFEANEMIRFVYRANHVYILFAGLLNVAVGAYLCLHARRWRRKLQVAGSIMLLIAPVILVLAFINEPGHASPQRPLTSAGVMLLFLAVLCHVPARK
jgi:heme A synthase